MLLLQSIDRFDSLAALDPSTGKLSWLSRSSYAGLVEDAIRGHVGQMDNRTLYFYRGDDGELHFNADGQDFVLAEDITANLSPVDEARNHFVICRGTTPLFDWIYHRPKIDPPLELDPTPFVGEEDYNLCLFASNVLNDADRRKRIYLPRTLSPRGWMTKEP